MPQDIQDHGDVSDSDDTDDLLKDNDKMTNDGSKKDATRPKRKKARRACYACQRAHLTCDDERPCQRCVRRGLGANCQDGVRKKAKYLHDAPPEALGPVLGYNPNPGPKRPAPSRHHSDVSQDFFSPTGTAPFSLPIYTTTPAMGFSAQTSPVSPSFHPPPPPPPPPPLSLPQQQQPQQQAQQAQQPQQPPPQQYAIPPGPVLNNFALFDPSNPGMFNFDLESINFGSQYGALEWGILGQMSSGVVETPSREHSMVRTPSAEIFSTMYGVDGQQQQQFGPLNAMMDGFVNMDHQIPAGLYSNGNLQHGLPHAYAIANGPASLASPDNTIHSEDSPNTQTFNVPILAKPVRQGPKEITYKTHGKRRTDASSVYDTTTEPYSYLAGFHNLIAFIQRRFNTNQTLSIAKSLASIRPSFISCMKTLDNRDLLMMEQVFQRTLIEHEIFLEQNSSPAIICRRTGEVVAVNNQFTALTGWTRSVLLGKDTNLNANTGTTNNSNDNLSSSPSSVKKNKPTSSKDRIQPVFIAELLDAESVVEFYKDFALLCFEDSRGERQRRGKLLKYRPGEEQGKHDELVGRASKKPRKNILSSRVTRIDGELGIHKIEKDGKVDCTYCWCIKRDPFDIPMMIVINFLPCYYRNQEPHQLAV